MKITPITPPYRGKWQGSKPTKEQIEARMRADLAKTLKEKKS
jgi:hypothetical protein